MHRAISIDDPGFFGQLHAGYEPAFNVLYERFYQRLYFFALRYVESADAQDAVSEAFIKFWNQRTGFEHVGSIGQFLFITVRSRCLDHLRRQSVHHAKQVEILRELEEADETDLFHTDIRTELLKLIYSEIDRLPARTREIFLLSFEEGLKPAEIAERLSLSVQTVSNQKLTAIRLLRAALGHRAVLVSLLVMVSASSLTSGEA